MNIFYLIIFLFCSFFHVNNGIASPSNPLFPSVMTYASLNEVVPPTTDAEWWFEINHIDIGHSGEHFVGIKSREPNFYYIQYRLMETITIDDANDMESWCKSNGYDPEDAYLHYYNDSALNINGQSWTTKGWGGGSASTRSEARMKTYMWGTWRYTLNWSNTCVGEYMKYRSVKDITSPVNGYYYNGIFVDEILPDTNPNGVQSMPNSTSGGLIVEYGNGTKAEVINSGKYINDLGNLFAAVAKAMHSTMGNSLLYPNIGDYTNNNVISLGPKADGLLTEFLCREDATYSSTGETTLWDIAKTMADSGKIFILTQGLYDPPSGPNFTAGNYLSTDSRHNMYSLASYWMGKQGNLTYYQQRPRWKPLSSYWVNAQEYDIGQPKANYYIWKTNTNPGDQVGQKYRIYRRDYTKAIVLFRTRYDWDPANFKDHGARSDYYDLGGNYRVLYPDGTLGPEINQIALSLSEGVVLIPSSNSNGVGNNPPTVSLTNPSNGATFTAQSNIAIDATATDSDGTISKVEFYQGLTRLGEDTTTPYSFTWSNVTAGSYQLTAKATDNSGAVTTSSPINISVNSTQSQQTPFSGTPFAFPRTIQAEDFDNGGEGVAYHDIEVANKGSQYRTSEGVDIETTGDVGGGYNVSWTNAGEWLEYTVSVNTSSIYDINLRVASNGSGGTFHIEFNGVDKTGPMTILNTGGWQNWQTITKTGVALSAGQQVMRIVMDTSGTTGYVGNLNYIAVTSALSTDTTSPSVPKGLVVK